MAGRYWLTGVQLGLVKGYVQLSKLSKPTGRPDDAVMKKLTLEILEEIEEKNFIGNSDGRDEIGFVGRKKKKKEQSLSKMDLWDAMMDYPSHRR